MKRLNLLTTLGLMALATTVQGCRDMSYSVITVGDAIQGQILGASGRRVTKEIRLEDFAALSTTGGLDVTYTQCEGRPTVVLSGSDNLVALVDAQVKAGTLHLSYKNSDHNIIVDNDLQIHVYSPTLTRIDVKGSGDISLDAELTTDALALNVTGSGSIVGDSIRCKDKLEVEIVGSGDVELRGIEATRTKLELRGSGGISLTALASNEVDVALTGSGDVTLKGTAETAGLSVAGSGGIHAVDLQAEDVTAQVAGSGDIDCHATARLDANVSGSGDIHYRGNPEVRGSRKGVHRL